MCARVFYLILAALFVFVTATVAAFVYLQWWQAILASAATLVMLVLAGKFVIRYFVGSLADIAKRMFEGKSRVLRNATADVHSVKPSALPQEVAEWIEHAEIPSTDPDEEVCLHQEGDLNHQFGGLNIEQKRRALHSVLGDPPV